MATIYSNLYAKDTSSPTGYGYKAPVGIPLPGVYYATAASYTGTVASDTLKVMKLPLGAKVHRIAVKSSVDMDAANTFTFNFGTTTTPTAYASAATSLQTATAFTYADTALIEAAVAVANDEILLTRAAGALATSGTIRFVVEWYIP